MQDYNLGTMLSCTPKYLQWCSFQAHKLEDMGWVLGSLTSCLRLAGDAIDAAAAGNALRLGVWSFSVS